MESDSVFLDTAALIALTNKSDGLHASAFRVYQELGRARTPLVTSQWVLAEFLGSASHPPLRSLALTTLRRLRTSPRVTVVEADSRGFEVALEHFAARSDKHWSLVDCSSMPSAESTASSAS